MNDEEPEEEEEGAYNSFLMLPVPSGSRTLKALRMTSSGSAPDTEHDEISGQRSTEEQPDV